jgi:hypothetical protein
VYAQVTVSGGFALSSLSDGSETEIGVGGNVLVDYLLPVNVPMSLGFEAGLDAAIWKETRYRGYDGGGNPTDQYVTEETVMVIPLLARVAYHFDLMPRLDLYVVGKIGCAFDFWEGEIGEEAYFSYGFDVGAAYYLSSTFGIFAEAGYDRYGDWFTRFLTVGVSVKFDTASSGTGE